MRPMKPRARRIAPGDEHSDVEDGTAWRCFVPIEPRFAPQRAKPPSRSVTMTDDELEDLTRRCAEGDPTAEAAYDKLTRAAIDRAEGRLPIALGDRIHVWIERLRTDGLVDVQEFEAVVTFVNDFRFDYRRDPNATFDETNVLHRVTQGGYSRLVDRATLRKCGLLHIPNDESSPGPRAWRSPGTSPRPAAR